MRVRKFGFLLDNAILTAMTRTLVRARQAAVTKHMLPKSRTAPVDPDRVTIRTGRMARSVRVERPRVAGDRFVGALIMGGLNLIYPAVHELLGAGRQRTKRPSIGPAVAEAAPGLRDDLGRELHAAQSAAGL